MRFLVLIRDGGFVREWSNECEIEADGRIACPAAAWGSIEVREIRVGPALRR